jgi:hypothetical protein
VFLGLSFDISRCLLLFFKKIQRDQSKPSRKCTAIDLEMRIRMTRIYAGGQSLSAIACELGSVLSAVNTIMKDAASMKEYVGGMTVMSKTET